MVDYHNDRQVISLNDSTWFKGNVINYTIEGCGDCEKLKVINHL